jgi:hypothetical protein
MMISSGNLVQLTTTLVHHAYRMAMVECPLIRTGNTYYLLSGT